MKKIYFNIYLNFAGKKTAATIVLREATDRILEEQEYWTEAINKKIIEYFGHISWDYIKQTNKENINKIIIDLSRKNETFEL